MVNHNIINYAKISKKTNIQIFAVTDHVSDLINRKFICEYIFIIFYGKVYFSNSKQRSINDSTTKAKYIIVNLAF